MKFDSETIIDAIQQWCALETKLYESGDRAGAKECREAISRLEDMI